MGAVWLIVLTVAAVGVLFSGLLSRREIWDLDEGEGLLATMRKQKERHLRAIKDIQVEHEAGTLTEEEHLQLRRDFKRRAVVASRELERVRRSRVRSLAKGGGGLTTVERARIEQLVTSRKENP